MYFFADRGKPCPYGLMYFSNLITAESSNIFANSFGGSKPPPYHVVVCFAKDGLIGSNPAEKLNKKITDVKMCLKN